MKSIHRTAGILVTLSLILILLITSIEIIAYGNWDYYRKEYTRLHVLDSVNISMDDLMDVTKEMMAYLRGNREDLVVVTTIDGVSTEFFNEQEKLHMADVRFLFVGGLMLRKICLVIAVLSVLLLIFTHAPTLSILTSYFERGSLLFIIITAILGALFASDFTKYFTIFHKIFFRNDLWLMDPATSRLINIVPEPFWVAVALRIAILFALLMAICFALCCVWQISRRRQKKASSN